jgi:hypothetical protein
MYGQSFSNPYSTSNGYVIALSGPSLSPTTSPTLSPTPSPSAPPVQDFYASFDFLQVSSILSDNYRTATAPDGTTLLLGSVNSGQSLPGQTSAGKSDVALYRYNASGAVTSQIQWGTNTYESGKAMAVGPTGEIYVGRRCETSVCLTTLDSSLQPIKSTSYPLLRVNHVFLDNNNTYIYVLGDTSNPLLNGKAYYDTDGVSVITSMAWLKYDVATMTLQDSGLVGANEFRLLSFSICHQQAVLLLAS